MRTGICITALILFCISHIIYLCFFCNSSIDMHYLKAWSALNISLLVIFSVVDELYEYETYIHRQFNIICKFTSGTTGLIIGLNHLCLIFNKENIFLALSIFIGSILALSAMVFISGLRHGIFKQTPENAI